MNYMLKKYTFGLWTLCCLLWLIPATVYGQAGVLIPTSDSNTPDPTALSLGEMSVNIDINNQFAYVRVMQIYTNHTNKILEGNYVFQIPTTAAISDFAVWDGDVRIPGVIIEKKRANELYEQIKRQLIDPGLLEEKEGESAFSTKIAPIAPYSTKRLEIEYTELLPVDNLTAHFSFPLKPSQYGQQVANAFHLAVALASKYEIGDFTLNSKQYPLAFSQQGKNQIVGSYEGSQISFSEDFDLVYKLKVPRSEMQFLAYRAPERITAQELRDPSRANPNPDGYFEASVIFSDEAKRTQAASQPRSVVLMLDTSLSMREEKLDRAIEAISYFLHNLKANDNFNLLLFNDDINLYSPEPVKAQPAEIEKALSFIQNSYLSGGTDLVGALKTGLAAVRKMSGDRSLVMITDGNPTLATTSIRKITSSFNEANKNIARLYVFGIGADSNTQLLSELVRSNNGYFTWARETEDMEYKLTTFFSKVGGLVIENVGFNAINKDNYYQVYPDVDRVSYDGSRFAFVGRYKRPGTQEALSISGQQAGQPVQVNAVVSLPESDNAYEHLPRMWAQARVNALLREIALNGETEAAINEIIALSKKYKFVTPYTSFLAAPRSLLRPRIIKPGDPVLRVRTDQSITSVVAVFPFGLTKELTYLKDEDIWETRFLAPKSMQDGTYQARLILTDEHQQAYQEAKSFVIDSKPPTIQAEVPKTITAGKDLLIKVKADKDTRRIAARLFGASPIAIKWNEQEHINIGRLSIPSGLPAGRYQLVITAEDFAHNSTNTELYIDILGQ